jgi:iodotyrosine deiodinase
LGTDEHKPHLTDAPYLIIVFEQRFYLEDGEQHKHYYVGESVGIAVGMLLTALHLAGLAALVHTPSPMRFLSEVLGRPRNEKAFAVIPVGYPAPDATVPDLVRKSLDQVLVRV